jgi:hypothetical protein
MRKKIATVARPFDGNVQVERLKRLMVDAIERKGRSYQLCHIGLHSGVEPAIEYWAQDWTAMVAVSALLFSTGILPPLWAGQAALDR